MKPSDPGCLHLLLCFHVLLVLADLLAELGLIVRLISISFGPLAIFNSLNGHAEMKPSDPRFLEVRGLSKSVAGFDVVVLGTVFGKIFFL